METQADEMAQRVQAARTARLNAQRMRRLAAERVERLERQLKSVAESGLRSEISRSIEVRGRLQAAGSATAAGKRGPAGRYPAFAAFGLLLGAAALGMGWAPLQDAAATGQPAAQAPVLAASPGDRLALSLSYTVSLPAAR